MSSYNMSREYNRSYSEANSGKVHHTNYHTNHSSRRISASGSRKNEKKRKLSNPFYRIRLLAAAIVLAFIFGGIAVHADPKGVTCSEDEFIYREITVEKGDTLWDIAAVWSGSTDDDIRTYIEKVKKMNHIHGDRIQEGQLLLIYHGQSVTEAAALMQARE